jgi:hypothetical protein
MLRSIGIIAAAFTIVACQDCDTACKGGITLYVADLAGSLSRGGSEPLHVCFDDNCQDVTITRDDSGGSVFLPFKGVGADIEHTLTVTGVGALKGEYTGKIDSYTQDPGGDCATCILATVKIGADGTLTPAVSATPAVTTTTTTTATTG